MKRAGPRVVVSAHIFSGALMLAAGAGALAIADGPGSSITYAGRSAAAAALLLAACFALAAAGLAVSFWGRRRRPGDLALLAAFLWLAPTLVAWQDGPELVRSIATVLAGFTFPLIAHLALTYPVGETRSGPVRALLEAMYFEALVAAVALALFRDPYFDSACWANCTVNSFLVHSLPAFSHTVEVADRWFVAGAAFAVVAICVTRMLTSSRPASARFAPVGVPTVMFAVTVAARAVFLQNIAVEDPFNATLFTIFALASVALILLGAGLIWSLVRIQAERRAVSRLVANSTKRRRPDRSRPHSLAHCATHSCRSPTGSLPRHDMSMPTAAQFPNPRPHPAGPSHA